MKQKQLPILFVAFSSFLYCILMWWRFPCHYRLMEGDSLFLFTRDFFILKLSNIPGLTNWLSDFFLQFFRWPFWGSLIEAGLIGFTLLSFYYLLVQRVKPLYLLLLGVVPVVLLFYHCDLRMLLQIFFFAVLLAIYPRLPQGWLRIVYAVFLLPIGYLLMCVPLLVFFFLLLATMEFKQRKKCVLYVLLCILVPFVCRIYSEHVAFVPFEKRYSWGGNPILKWSDYDEQCYSYAELAENQEWDRLLTLLKKKGKDDNAVRRLYALLAEHAMGTLPDNLFSYTINDPEAFLIRHSETPFARLFNRQFYATMGICDEAMHFSMEYSLNQLDGCCFSTLRNMAEYSIREADFPVAEKYLTILEKSMFHKSFVKEKLAEISRLKENGVFSKAPLRADNFVGGYPFCSEMIRQVERDPQNQGFLDYLLCGLLLQKKLSEFCVVMHTFPIYKGRPLPKAFAEAAAVLESEGYTMRDVFQYPVELDGQFREFQTEVKKNGNTKDFRYRHSFWEYLYFADISAVQNNMVQGKGH